MSLCDALALLIGLFGGFFSVVCASRDWFEHRFPVKEEKLSSRVAAIKRQHEAGATGGQDCEAVARATSSSMKWYRIFLLTPTLIFLGCTGVCAYYSCRYYDEVGSSPAPKWQKPWFINSVIAFGFSMLSCWILALIARIKASTNWDRLGRDLKWVPENEDEYSSIAPMAQPNKPAKKPRKPNR